ncbi:heparan-alpha-glucosaminide N-acetyltransferase domain-containing protein [uncultured Kriegella sp.]|uniref:heparan-alpha-glucosaminide N-acetyltransferase domain-containing protein n=1 Tax=uncultured Kriegella sp. TaxID=1798910 RepID=UPI0030DD95FC|tara:strand:- start:305646 stop:306830 length:1185 start_codon:yes stop_codon:yes gene_type:complete
MERKTARLYFIDAIRAWAILMMLQGHFVDGLLDMSFRDGTNTTFGIWKYFRGITAPVFFTVSGFIFTYLLVRGDKVGFENPRVKKGIKRGLELLLIGYLLRINLFGLLQGQIYESFYLIDVLHCIGLSILGIVSIYLITYKQRNFVFPLVLVTTMFFIFLFEPLYATWNFSSLPRFLANYLTRSNGSVFTILPWFGYAATGGFLSLLFTRFKNYKYLYPTAIVSSIAIGLGLILFSSDFFYILYKSTEIQLFNYIILNNYLFIRLGDVFVVFAIFMLLRSFLQNRTLLKIGQSTLSIYVVHFIILYGSFTGLGLYRFFHHELPPETVIPSALIFMLICTYTALQYERHKEFIKLNIATTLRFCWIQTETLVLYMASTLKTFFFRLLRRLGLAKN